MSDEERRLGRHAAVRGVARSILGGISRMGSFGLVRHVASLEIGRDQLSGALDFALSDVRCRLAGLVGSMRNYMDDVVATAAHGIQGDGTAEQ